ncbi:ATP-binding protein [Slackia heliotrinireducens]|uniref:Sensor-like histidine kinase SenX3 n=1 Tax=Slackia heliotrinireducens (strain ATCC 29202 / DSM 20476 / NCTC 11029 / RHS 1) TaxID=471855 RepID=C7N0N1_SLAHD|nr:ATP-binding protein [Slackia heliotrinireducens]ACV21109.1 signal transduction histidine kinase [Slackia heliotrinireducens DSM 20476]
MIALLTAMVAMGVLSFVWEQHFSTYTRENIQALADVTATTIAQDYSRNHENAIAAVDETGEGQYPNLSVVDVSAAASAHQLKQSMGVVVTNADGSVIYDTTTLDKDGNRITDSESLSVAPRLDGGATATQADIIVEGTRVGTVRMWIYGSDVLLSKADMEFRSKSYEAMVLATVFSVLLASCLGVMFSRGLTRPIERITQAAAAIKEGDWSARSQVNGADEIAELSKTFDSMAESIENDRDLQHRLTTDVAHELRTPLMAIQSTVEAIVDGVFEPTAERLATISDEVGRLRRLVDALLRLSRLENRATPMKQEVVNVGELIRTITTSHEAYVADAGLKLEYDPEDEVMVYGDPDMIRQATANLISNAVRYTPAPGTIWVRVRKDDEAGEATIAVQDTGIGLTPEECRMVFSRFWRAEGSRKRETGGLGIGLTVVKEIIDRHHGWVEVQGEKDVGATFTLHIPLYDYDRIKAQTEKREGKGSEADRPSITERLPKLTGRNN